MVRAVLISLSVAPHRSFQTAGSVADRYVCTRSAARAPTRAAPGTTNDFSNLLRAILSWSVFAPLVLSQPLCNVSKVKAPAPRNQGAGRSRNRSSLPERCREGPGESDRFSQPVGTTRPVRDGLDARPPDSRRPRSTAITRRPVRTARLHGQAGSDLVSSLFGCMDPGKARNYVWPPDHPDPPHRGRRVSGAVGLDDRTGPALARAGVPHRCQGCPAGLGTRGNSRIIDGGCAERTIEQFRSTEYEEGRNIHPDGRHAGAPAR